MAAHTQQRQAGKGKPRKGNIVTKRSCHVTLPAFFAVEQPTMQQLHQLKQLHLQGFVTTEEYNVRRIELVNQLTGTSGVPSPPSSPSLSLSNGYSNGRPASPQLPGSQFNSSPAPRRARSRSLVEGEMYSQMSPQPARRIPNSPLIVGTSAPIPPPLQQTSTTVVPGSPFQQSKVTVTLTRERSHSVAGGVTNIRKSPAGRIPSSPLSSSPLSTQQTSMTAFSPAIMSPGFQQIDRVKNPSSPLLQSQSQALPQRTRSRSATENLKDVQRPFQEEGTTNSPIIVRTPPSQPLQRKASCMAAVFSQTTIPEEQSPTQPTAMRMRARSSTFSVETVKMRATEGEAVSKKPTVSPFCSPQSPPVGLVQSQDAPAKHKARLLRVERKKNIKNEPLEAPKGERAVGEEKDEGFEPEVLRVFLRNQAYKSVLITRKTNAGQVCRKIVEKLGVEKYVNDFEMVEYVNGSEKSVPPYKNIVDLKKSWPKIVAPAEKAKYCKLIVAPKKGAKSEVQSHYLDAMYGK